MTAQNVPHVRKHLQSYRQGQDLALHTNFFLSTLSYLSFLIPYYISWLRPLYRVAVKPVVSFLALGDSDTKGSKRKISQRLFGSFRFYLYLS